MENNNFEYIRSRYSVPAEFGRKVNISGRPGVITKDLGCYIGVVFDDEKPHVVQPFHPTHNVEYLPDLVKPRKITRSQQRYQDYLDSDSGLCFIDWLKLRINGK